VLVVGQAIEPRSYVRVPVPGQLLERLLVPVEIRVVPHADIPADAGGDRRAGTVGASE